MLVRLSLGQRKHCELDVHQNSRFLLLGLVIAALSSGAAVTAQQDGKTVPASPTCTVTLDLPDGTRVVVDGRDYGTKRTLAFEKLPAGREYTSTIRLTLERGAVAERRVKIRAGANLNLALADFVSATDGLATWRNPLAATRAASAAVSPDGRYVATISGDENVAEIFDAKSGQRLQRLAEHNQRIRSLAFSADGKRLVTSGEDNTVLVWDVASGKRVLKFTPPEHPKWAATSVPTHRFRPFMNLGEALGAGMVDVLDQSFVEPLRARHSHVHSVVFSPDGKQILSAQFDGSVRLWDAATGRETRQYCGPTSMYGNEFLPVINTAAFSADGRRVVAADQTGYVRVWDTSSGQRLLQIRADEHAAYSAQFSPDGKRLLTVGVDRVARLWNAADGKHEHLLYPGVSGSIDSACFAADGNVLTLGADSTLRTWDPETGKEVKNVVLAPRWTAKTLLVASLADDSLLTKGMLGFQTRDAGTGRIARQFHSGAKSEAETTAPPAIPAKKLPSR